MTADTDLLNYEQSATLLHCSKKTLERAWKAGEIDAFKPGKEVLFRRSDLMKWLNTTKLRPKVHRGRRKQVVICGGAR